MDELIAYRNELLSALRRDVEELDRLEASLADHEWHEVSNHASNTLHYMLYRLSALECQEFAPHIRRILEENMPNLKIFDEQAWMAGHYSTSDPVHSIIRAFSGSRLPEVEILCNLPSSSWSRSARHPWWGVHTLQWWVELQREVTHESLQQLAVQAGI